MIGKPKPPKCRECGKSNPIAVSRGPRSDSQGGGVTSHTWLCGDCLYLRDHPNAAPAVPMPNDRRPRRLQKERLFDL